MTSADPLGDAGSARAVTVVIPARNAVATLGAQLAALDRQTGDIQFNVIVVDNGSTDGTGALAAAHVSPRYSLRVVHEPVAGTNSARNAGIALVDNGMVLLCDADDEVSPQWVSELVAAWTPGTWVAGIVDYTTLNSARTRLQWGAAARSAGVTPEPFVDWTFSCNCGFDRAMWADIGGFDATLSGVGGDDTEFFMRAYAAGYRQRWAPDALVAYRLRAGVRNMCRQRYRQGRNQVRVASRSAASAALAPGRGATVRSLAWLLLATPRYLFTASRRYQWLGAACGHVGRLVGYRAVDA